MKENEELKTMEKSSEVVVGETATERKRLAPPPPVVTDIDQRIRGLEEKGKRRGRRNSWIGILSSILILVVVVLIGYYLLAEINKLANQVDMNNSSPLNHTEDPEGFCVPEDDCCLTSLSRLRKNGYMMFDELGVCPEGSITDRLKCPTSLSWCRPLTDDELEAGPEIDRVEIDTTDWAVFSNSDYGFSFPYPADFFVDAGELEQMDRELKKVYVTQTATATDYYFILKIIDNIGSSSVAAHIAEQEQVLNSLASTTGVNSSLESMDYRTEHITGKKIIVKTTYQGTENVSEEIILANNRYLYTIAYPIIASSTAVDSQMDIMRGIITSFNFLPWLSAPLTETEAENSQPVSDESLAADAVESLDSDQDGLSDADEILYGTDPYNADTDGDGFSDGDEVKNGFNPLGDGLL